MSKAEFGYPYLVGDGRENPWLTPRYAACYAAGELAWLSMSLLVPRCGGRLRLIAVIDHPAVVARILRHQKLPSEIPGTRRARAPPTEPRLPCLSHARVVQQSDGALDRGRTEVHIPLGRREIGVTGQLLNALAGAPRIAKCEQKVCRRI